MGLNSFVKLFTPKDKIFYSLFEEVASNLVAMGHVLNNAMNEEDKSKRDQLLKSLDNFEHKNDEFTHQIFIQLGQNFITPFDREDIHYLATALDDVADYTWGSAKQMLMYNIDSVNDTMRRFSAVILESVKTLEIAIKELRNMKKLKAITDACVKINSLENEADDILDESISHLFTYEVNNPVELLKKKELYQEMEFVTDKCEDAANVIESIIIKYS